MAELAPTDNSITTKVSSDIAWARHHLFLLAVVLILAFAGIYGVESLIAKHDDAKWEQTKLLMAMQTAQTKALSEKFDADKKIRDAENAAKDAEIFQLAQAIAKRDAATEKQIQKNATLSAAEAAQRLAQQTGGQVTAQGDVVVANLPLGNAQKLISALDLLPTVQADLVDTKKQLADVNVKNNNLQSDVKEQKGIVGALQTTLAGQQQACQQQIDKVNSNARKSKTKIAAIFAVVGIVAARVLGI